MVKKKKTAENQETKEEEKRRERKEENEEGEEEDIIDGDEVLILEFSLEYASALELLIRRYPSTGILLSTENNITINIPFRTKKCALDFSIKNVDTDFLFKLQSTFHSKRQKTGICF